LPEPLWWSVYADAVDVAKALEAIPANSSELLA
jgi:hypothetical protein